MNHSLKVILNTHGKYLEEKALEEIRKRFPDLERQGQEMKISNLTLEFFFKKSNVGKIAHQLRKDTAPGMPLIPVLGRSRQVDL